jgi:hypothetical protein
MRPVDGLVGPKPGSVATADDAVEAVAEEIIRTAFDGDGRGLRKALHEFMRIAQKGSDNA